MMGRGRTERDGRGGHGGHGGPRGRGGRLLGMLLLLLALLAPLAGIRAVTAQADDDPAAKTVPLLAQDDEDEDEDEDAPADEEATAEATADADADADAADDPSAGDDAETYESPQYGYTLSYDAAEWEGVREDDDPDDPYDVILLDNGASSIGLFGDPDYAEDELDNCVEDYLGGLEGGDGVSDIEPMDEPGAADADDGRAWATFAYVLADADGDEVDAVRYIECLALGKGVTLVTVQDAAADDYEAEIAAREALLEGLDAAGVRNPGADDDQTGDAADDPDDADETPEAGADDDDGASDDSNDAGDAGDAASLDGDWEGESEDGVAFSFVVEDGGVLSVSYGYECDGEPIFAGAANSDPTPIEDGAFVFETESSGGTTTVTGTISDGEAEGTLEREATDPEECDVEFDWTAEAA